MAAQQIGGTFYGWRVVGAVFVLAMFGWGLGFYGPPVYLHAVRETRGWSLMLVSTAVTVHYLFGAIVVANMPRLTERFGVAAVTKAGTTPSPFVSQKTQANNNFAMRALGRPPNSANAVARPFERRRPGLQLMRCDRRCAISPSGFSIATSLTTGSSSPSASGHQHGVAKTQTMSVGLSSGSCARKLGGPAP